MDASGTEHDPALRARRRRWWWAVPGVPSAAVLLLALFWNWDWFVPLVNAQASAALGRRVSVRHLHVRLGRRTTAVVDDVVVANPPNFAPDPPLARVAHLTVTADVMAYLRQGRVVLPFIGVEQPVVAATVLRNGDSNAVVKPPERKAKAGPAPEIGTLRIIGGAARLTDARHGTDVTARIDTQAAKGGRPETIVATAEGSYAGQRVTAAFTGGAVLTLRDASQPYPIDLEMRNGPTRLTVKGTVSDPAHLKGSDVRVTMTGTDMSLLFPLTGIPFPRTPPFSLAGRLDYEKPRVKLRDFEGRVGSSDLRGTITEDPGAQGKPDVTMDLASRRLDLTDLGGLIGTTPGRQGTPGQTVAQKRELAKTEAKSTLLPDTPISMPKLNAANLHVTFHGEHIINKYVPFDDIGMRLDLVDGRIEVHKLDLRVGQGHIVGTIALAPATASAVRTDADIRFQRVDLTRILEATHLFRGRGTIGGQVKLAGTGRSLADIMAHGDGGATLALLGGGNLSALLVDLSGLQFGNALLSALGVPDRATIQCFVADLPVRGGVMRTRALLLDTDEGRVTGEGSVDFRDQTMDMSLTTRSMHFSVGSLPGPIEISGKLGAPSIRPGAEVAARAGAAGVLGVLLTPLGALLPTVQFGVGEDNACTRALQAGGAPSRAGGQRR